MTVSSKKPQESNLRPRSGEMDDLDGRLKFVSEDSAAEFINDQDSHYTQLQLELESDALNLEAETWSLSVDQSFLKELSKETVKRQEVIYELMHTEMHHVRTLKVLLYVYMYELRQSGMVDEQRLERLFPAIDALLSHHQHFLDALKRRQRQSQEPEGSNNYQITQLGDILITQFSGSVGEGMKECYSVFCGHQSEANKFYKELLQNSKKFQNLIRKIGQLPLVKRLGIPECFLLVTQRITKYPVLIERIIKNTEENTDEYKSLVHGLSLIKDTIEQVNTLVKEYEQVQRLREIYGRLEPKSLGRVSEERVFKREDLLLNNRTLLHEGSVVWKTPGRQKEIHAVLLSDVLILLQEKDQKFVFATMEKIPPVISLRALIVREMALEDRAMYLICSCTSNMYEIHTSSKDECNSWMTRIREAVNSFVDEEEPYSEEMAQLQQFQNSLKECDDLIQKSVESKQQVCVSLFEAVTGQECPHKGLLLWGDASDLQQGETLLQEAIHDVENLHSMMILGVIKKQSEITDGLDETSDITVPLNGDVSEDLGAEPSSDLQYEETDYSEGLELSADGDDVKTPPCTLTPKPLQEQDTLLVYQRMVLLAQRLNSLQVVLAKHSSQVEMLQACQSKSKRSSRQGNTLLEQENQRNMERQKQELANLHKMQAQQREEQQRWEKEKAKQRVQMEVLEEEVKKREEECKQREQRLMEEKADLEKQRGEYQQDLERLRDSLKNLEKDKEKTEQEKKKLEKLKRHMSMVNPALNMDDPKSLLSFPSIRSTVSSVGNITAAPYVVPTQKSDSKEVPPRVPPRRESISPKPTKPYVPIHLRSTTNDTSPAVRPGGAIEQVIPTKLEGISKKKVKTKPSHKRTNSAANIDVREVVPIRVTGKEGGSLRSQRTSSPQRIHQNTDLFTPPGPSLNMKPPTSTSSQRRGSSDDPPPVPPPFPKEILDPLHPKEIFL
ncbi:rho guanine nucleotide exchange factor 18a [Boleophthalmus pectinirostris]|uniref:rho guanine nucleotide exchange factor 18a n=1 Tax=Boleophthalmus pectinirostris TaxID=150288 RepID=UPI002431D6C1|nr:rho guanine nucleotide exchange factor 18a [Boleophthalmus pectinirostris]XP_020784827.2 rho guanine nucleotide exchange factor 18a [Boleophthalmus pectinirostris]XP_020784828.2 rho guanine nucleotide exchange factor 18a [Boleophthalmus pectinirostris]